MKPDTDPLGSSALPRTARGSTIQSFLDDHRPPSSKRDTTMHIGLIGGIGPAATDYYYRGLIAAARDRDQDLALTIAHADSPTLLENQASGDETAQVEIFTRLAHGLRAGGADLVAVTAISGHFCIEAFESASPLPVSNLISAVDRFVAQQGYKRLGILGTEVAMRTRLYGGISSATVVPPTEDTITAVHRTYIEMAFRGSATDADRDVLYSAYERAIEENEAEAVILAGTDLVLAFDSVGSKAKVIDCAAVHVAALAEQIG